MNALMEKDLILPAVYVIGSAKSATITSPEMVAGLTAVLKPSGDMLVAEAGRNASKFNRLVLNLKSHRTLVKEGLAIYGGDKNGTVSLTPKGKAVFKSMTKSKMIPLNLATTAAAKAISDVTG